MIVKDLNTKAKVLSYQATTEYVYNDLILAETAGERYALLVNSSGLGNRIPDSATRLIERGFGDLPVYDRIDHQIRLAAT